MAITIDWVNKVVHSDASITDAVAFHLVLRDREDDVDGIIHDVIHTYKEIDLGSGAKFPAVAFINGYTLEFPIGNFEMRGGNINAPINPVAGAFVKQTQSAAYAVTSVGAGGATPADIADAVRTNLTPELAKVSTTDAATTMALKILRNKTVTNPVTGVMTVYDDDGVTVLLSAVMHEDIAQAQTYRGQGAEVRGRLA